MTVSRAVRNSLLAGLACSLVGLVVGAWLAQTAIGDGYGVFLVAAPAAALLTTALLWWLIVARPDKYSIGRGVTAGALAGAVAHVTCWLFLLWGASACHALTGGCASSLAEAPMNPLQALAAAPLYAFFSLIMVGWITVPAGALIGGVLARAQRSTTLV